MVKLILLSFLLCSCATKSNLPKEPLEAPPTSYLFPIQEARVFRAAVGSKLTPNSDTRVRDQIDIAAANRALSGPLKGKAEMIQEIADKEGISARVMLGIIGIESGMGKSRLARQNNFSGLMKKGKGLSFSTPEKGVRYFAERIKKHYHGRGLYSISAISKIYCPPNSKYWVKNVCKIGNRY